MLAKRIDLHPPFGGRSSDRSSSLTGENSWDSSGERSLTDLSNVLKSKGVTISRVTRTYKTKYVVVTLSSLGDGLQYSPASDKHSALLFANMRAVRALPSTDPIYRKARLGPFQHCLQIESSFGWSWYLICATELDRGTWMEFLEQRRRSYVVDSRTNVTDVCITRYWANAAPGGKTKVSFNEVSVVFKSLFGHIPPDEFARRFRESDADNDTYLTFDEFRSLFLLFNDVDHVRSMYEKCTSDAQMGMSAQEFTRFCTINDGGSNVTPMRCAALFHLFTNRQAERLSLPVFTAFLLHPQHNSAVDQRHRRVADSMEYPLNCYFISSSHNTYLLGNQLNSESSSSAYRDTLRAGCRCVEIDCWDGSDGQPSVYHGHTMTTRIRFEDVIRTINAHAFQNPAAGDQDSAAFNPREFPVILSLEVHTSTEQTSRMAEIMQRIFGERLFMPPEDASAYTPAALKNKILVKWKMNAAGVEEVKDTTGSGIRPDRRAPSRATTSPLSACASIGSVKTTTWGAREQPYHVESFTEGEVGRLGMTEPLNFTRQNTRMMARTYPQGTRIDSSNYDPMPMWRLGCQMVALNWQTRDQALRVNEGFFSHQNGGCGYVLKPSYLRDVGSTLQNHPFTLTLRIICGSHLSNTYDGVEAAQVSLRVWLHGSPLSFETNTVPAGVYPQWDEMVKLRGEYRELDVLCMRVVARTAGGSSHDVCTAYLPVAVLRTGYHAVPVCHVKGGSLDEVASVFCQISIDDEAPGGVVPVGGGAGGSSSGGGASLQPRAFPIGRRPL